jgi:hypothetical protein
MSEPRRVAPAGVRGEEKTKTMDPWRTTWETTEREPVSRPR